MTRVFLTLAFMATIVFSYAQKQVTFKVALQPNLHYTSAMNVLTMGTMDFTGDKSIIDQIKASGMTLPINIKSVQDVVMTIKTQTRQPDKEFPLEIQYTKMTTSQDVGGKKVDTPNPFEGIVILGRNTADDKIKFDSIRGVMDEQTKKILFSTVENMQKSIEFPDKPMKIGDTFTQEIPMSLPMGGVKQIDMVITTVYKLVDISNQMATFDMDIKLSLDMAMDQGSATATGGGKGKAKVDLKYNYMVSTTNTMDMDMKIKVDKIDISSKLKIVSDQQVTIVALK